MSLRGVSPLADDEAISIIASETRLLRPKGARSDKLNF